MVSASSVNDQLSCSEDFWQSWNYLCVPSAKSGTWSVDSPPERNLLRRLTPDGGRGVHTPYLQTLDGPFSAVSKKNFASEYLVLNTHVKALAEIYITHSFAPLSDLNFFVSKIAKMLPNFAEMLLESRCFPNLPKF